MPHVDCLICGVNEALASRYSAEDEPRREKDGSAPD